MENIKNYEKLIGKVMKSVTKVSDDVLLFETIEGKKYKFYHEQECCESVYIESIDGDLADLEGSPILMAEETVTFSDNHDNYGDESYSSWTFYKFATNKGYVTVRWCGSSNGYYSESVDFCEES